MLNYGYFEADKYLEDKKMTKKLEKLKNFDGVQGPVLTIVMDGVGLAPDTVSNAVAGAYTPNLDALMKNY
ncbi:MAG: hypothetical protein J6Q70_01510, partial [Clostridia bacterium]|nr:hypothetical protein [Clostridia bacterium]